MEIIEVKSSKQFRDFLNLPRKIYSKSFPHYIDPLAAQVKMMIGKLNSPEKHLFLVKQDGQTVARCGFKTHVHGSEKALHFGFYECLEGHQEASQALFQKAHSLYPDLKIKGPFHFRMEDPYIGVLVEGFDIDPYFLMAYNPPYYDEYLRKAGFVKVMDLYTYELRRNIPLSDILLKNAQRARDNGYTIRLIDKKNLRKEARTIALIFNDALSNNWGFEEFIDSQVDEMVLMFKYFLDLRIVAIAQKDEKDIGSLIMIPNFNHMLRGLGGKVFPKLLWRYFVRNKFTHGEARGYALGVLKGHHGSGIGSLLVEEMYRLGGLAGYDKAEISWVLANNGPMNELAKAMSGKQNKVYRIFEKTTGSAPELNAEH